MEEIKDLRKQIDEIDEKLVKLLNERAQISLAIRELKIEQDLPIHDDEREAQIIDFVKNQGQGPLSEEGLAEIYEIILKWMKNNG